MPPCCQLFVGVCVSGFSPINAEAVRNVPTAAPGIAAITAHDEHRGGQRVECPADLAVISEPDIAAGRFDVRVARKRPKCRVPRNNAVCRWRSYCDPRNFPERWQSAAARNRCRRGHAQPATGLRAIPRHPKSPPRRPVLPIMACPPESEQPPGGALSKKCHIHAPPWA
jgi:hypothetical protein